MNLFKKEDIMKKYILIVLTFFLTSLIFYAQEDQLVTVRNITVPVQVMDGKTFVDNLKLEDFELQENGIPQNIEALYLVKNGNIERQDERVGFFPAVGRHFYLMFQMTDYNPKIAEAIHLFFNSVLAADDLLTVQTPLKVYTLPSAVLKSRPRDSIAKDLISIVRKDTMIGNANYKNLMRELKRLVRGIQTSGGGVSQSTGGMESDLDVSQFGLQYLLPRYREALQKMEDFRVVNEKKILNFAEQLRKVPGEKVVFLFYQREYRPEISPSVLNRLLDSMQGEANMMAELQGLFGFYQRNIHIDTDLVKKAFSNALVNFNLLFMNKEPENVSGVYMREQSEDLFKIYSQVAQATGGVVDSSQNPAAGFKNAAASCQSYYLLYYSPKNYVQNGSFKKIEIRIKGQNYKIAHRLGYYAN